MAVRPYHLMLLPPPPQPISLESLRAAYYTPLWTVLRRLDFNSRKTTTGTVLEIAVAAPHLVENASQPRSVTFATSQTLIASIYRLVVSIAVKESINVEDNEGIDVRVVLLAYPKTKDSEPNSTSSIEGNFIGPVIDIQTLAGSNKGWENIFSVKGEEGDQLLNSYLTNQDSRVKYQKVTAGTVNESDSEQPQADAHGKATDGAPHYAIAIGGTFDHLHIGHKLLLTMTAYLLEPADESTERVLTIGITGDELLKNKKAPELLESWNDRTNVVSEFMQDIMDFRPKPGANVEKEELSNAGPNGHAVHIMLTPRLMINCVEIGDPFGPTITDETITGMVLTAETRSGGTAVNEKRSEKGWAELELHEVDVLDALEGGEGSKEDTNFESKISSTGIRQKLAEKAKKRNKK